MTEAHADGAEPRGRTPELTRVKLTAEEYLAELLALVSPSPRTAQVALDEAIGRVLAAGLAARVPNPAFTNSAMDGYAVRAADTTGASFDRGIRLEVTGTAAAGRPCLQDVGPGLAVRVMTGAVLPERADAVVRFEETDEGTTTSEAASVVVFHPAKPGDNVREAGEDIPAGMVLLERGRLLRPAELGLLAAANRPKVRVHRQPRVAILSTGDEVVDPGEPLAAGQTGTATRTRWRRWRSRGARRCNCSGWRAIARRCLPGNSSTRTPRTCW